MNSVTANGTAAMEEQLRARLREIERSVERLQNERQLVEARLKTLAARRAPKPTPKRAAPAIACPRCGRDRDFLTDNGGYLGHVLEDPSDTEDLEPGKPLFCPACGEVFLFQPPTAAAKRR